MHVHNDAVQTNETKVNVGARQTSEVLSEEEKHCQHKMLC